MSECDNSSSSPPAPLFEGTLNVFLHGLIGVLNTETGIDLLIPDIGPAHAYRFGEFLGEVTLPPSPSPYHITGIEPGPTSPAPFPQNEHLCTVERKPVCVGAALYARIKLPHPKCVHSYLKVDLTDVIEDPLIHLVRNDKGRMIGTMTPVLEYDFKDPRLVMFGTDPLNVAPVWSYKTKRWYMNLHIFAEEDVERPEEHTTGGFDNIAALFDFELTPRLISVSNIPPAHRDRRPPPGTTHLEFLSLALRTRELGYLGRRVRFQLLNGHEPAIVQVSSVGGDPITCLPLVSQHSRGGLQSHA